MRLALLILWLAASVVRADNFMLRWTPLQWTNFVQRVAGTNSGSTNSTAGLQWGSVNLTNWSGISTNVLTGLLRQTNFVAQTNTVWITVGTYEQSIFVPNAAVDSNATLFSESPAANTLYRVDAWNLVDKEDLGQFNNSDRLVGVAYTTTTGATLSEKVTDFYTDAVNTSAGGRTYYRTSKSLLVAAKSGTTFSVTNRVYVDGSDNYLGTNYFRLSVSKETNLVTARFQ